MLQRPLGVKERPSTFVKTWGEKQMELIDPEKRRAQRDHLIKEVGKGYFADLNRTRKFGGKTWIAPPTAIREDKALYFPDIAGTPLDKNTKVHTTDLLRGKISVVGILTTQISDEHIRYFVQSTNAAFLNPQYPRYQHVLINLQENVLKSMLVSIFLSSIRRSVPPEMHSRYLASSQNMEFVREDMGMVNKHIGYVYLVDENLKIRWAGCGDAKAEESEALLRCTKVLLERLQQKVPEKGEKNVKGAVK
ncbi:hypothetical protein GLOTRDRAFT_140565 [Gloeophyllum trabeum ATCC 11539]|uniref:Uncharacterized protein n=1 Tax=Gloeophyllum trabeum (strain ATCC 11539 / FP-39264 / Madison 617) TaxID=670483 RepID=S7PWZ0_GLOTA|nr:uncharacterized protein GLOTRDRAFT_140565 [Gloeophyllum trabeum ATCC 11539]EPQ52136.1 hypothetical protein GLOTRDRAFT_140565 [Gloeophyllum trabeum ATCC 11539]